MRLTVIGCSGSLPGPDSAASCYLVEAPYRGRTFRLLLDLGSGALGALQRYAPLESIEAVLLSHLHADHYLDLCGLWVFHKYHPGAEPARLQIYGPTGTANRLAAAYGIETSPGMTGEFDIHTYPLAPLAIGPFTVTVTPVEHPVPAFAIRVSDGERTLVYSGDTGPCTPLEQIATGCDLFLVEAAFVDGDDNPKHLHLSGRQAGEIAQRAGAGRLVLTHIPPWHSAEKALAEAQPYFTGDISLASVGAAYDV
ncbi:MAG: MBL fold metallo-hydrolase [Nocardioidaceae bacterium]